MVVPRDEIAEAMGVGRKGMLWWRLLALCLVPLTAVFGGGWLFELYREPQIVPHIVWVDNDNMRVLAEATANQLTDREAAYSAVGRLWVWNLRSRSPHMVMNQALEREAQKLSDQKAYKRVAAMLKQMNEELDCDETRCSAGIEVGGVMTAQVDQISKDQAGNEFAIVDVTWHERKYGATQGVGPAFGFAAKLHIMRLDPPRTGEIPPNPFGLYVSEYVFDRTGPVRSVAEASQ